VDDHKTRSVHLTWHHMEISAAEGHRVDFKRRTCLLRARFPIIRQNTYSPFESFLGCIWV